MMNLKYGDYVMGDKITIGKFLGHEEVKVGQAVTSFCKVYEYSKKMTHYIPETGVEDLNKLPSKSVLKKYLSDFDEDEYFDLNEIEGSRFRYFEQKLNSGGFQAKIEVLHDLKLLKEEKKITIAEHRIYNQLREVLSVQISYILELEDGLEFLC